MGEAWRKKTQNRIIFVFDFFPKSGISSAFLAELGYISTSVTAMTPRRHLIGQRWPPPTTRRWPHFRRLNRLVLTTLNNTQKSPDYSIPLENGRRPTMATHIRRVEDPIFRISGGGGGTHIHKTSKKRYPITRLLYSTKKKKNGRDCDFRPQNGSTANYASTHHPCSCLSSGGGRLSLANQMASCGVVLRSQKCHGVPSVEG